MNNKLLATLTAVIIGNPLYAVGTFIVVAIAPSIIAPQPASAAWWDSVDGVFFSVNGNPYYFGSYVTNPNLEFEGSTWSIRMSGNCAAHGYNRTIPGVVKWLADRL
jgi:hypothetical protein